MLLLLLLLLLLLFFVVVGKSEIISSKKASMPKTKSSHVRGISLHATVNTKQRVESLRGGDDANSRREPSLSHGETVDILLIAYQVPGISLSMKIYEVFK